MSYRRHRQTPNEKHEQKTRHADTLRDASYISSFSFRKFWRFSCKAKYARLRTFPPSPFGATEDMPRSLVGSRGSSFQPCFSATANKRFVIWQVLVQAKPASIKDHSSLSRDIADFPCPPSAENSYIISYSALHGIIIHLIRAQIRSIRPHDCSVIGNNLIEYAVGPYA